MKNITIAIDNEILDKVRIVAARKRTTVNAMVRNYLTEVAGGDERQAEARQLLRLMETSKGRMAPDWKFDREETHER
jgi:2-C-methyl-D-erythritol 4-phosphate cytidylyltransferase